MDNRENYTAVGLFVVILGLFSLFMIYWLSGNEHHKFYRTYVVNINESVSGLRDQAPVRYNGVKVGFVESIALNPKDPQQVRLKLRIERGTPVTEATVAMLKSQGVTGIQYIGLKAQNNNTRPLMVRPNERYPVIKSVPSLLVQLNTAISDLTINLSIISDSFRKVFDEENANAIKHTLHDLQSLSSIIVKNSGNIESTLRSTKHLLSNAAKASDDLPVLIQEMHKTSLAMDKMANNVTHASHDLSKTLDSSQLALSNISQQALPNAVALFQKLQRVTTNLEQLSDDLRANPSMMLRGRQAKTGPGE